MNVMSLDVQTDGDKRGSWRLHVIGDLHLDDIATDQKRIADHIAFIASDPCSIYVVVGDLVTGSTPGHKFFDTSVIRPSVLRQMNRYVDHMVDELVELFKPLQDRSGIWFQGNHDIRKGIDYSGIVGRVASETGGRYGGDEALVRICAPRPDGTNTQIWKLHGYHGGGTSGAFPGSKVNRFQHTVGVLVDADLHVRGHVHDSDIRIINKTSVSASGKTRLTTSPRAFITAPSYAPDRTEGVHGYAGQKGMPPLDHGCQFVHCENGRSGKYPKRIYREEWRG